MYFIYDCNEKVVGNPNGYRTFKGAEIQQNSRKSKAYKAIWKAFYKVIPPRNHIQRVSSIKLVN